MSGDLRVIQRGPLEGMPGGIEGLICADPDRKIERILIVRCKACGRGVVGRLLREGAQFRPDGELSLAHVDTCPVLVAMQAGADGAAQ